MFHTHHLHKEVYPQVPPDGLVLQEGGRYASFDGDADRVVYYTSIGGAFTLLVGRRRQYSRACMCIPRRTYSRRRR
jgi:hypothetical protein